MKTLKVLVVENRDGDVEQSVRGACRDIVGTGAIVRVMRGACLVERDEGEPLPETEWNYDVIVLDLQLEIFDAVKSETIDSYTIEGKPYGGCYIADLLARSEFKGYVLVNSAFLTKLAATHRKGLNEIQARQRLFTFSKASDNFGTLLRQVLAVANDGVELSSALHRKVLFAASTDHPVLLLGATGTGKELLARRIHLQWTLSRNGQKTGAVRPFISINCALLRGELLRSELMGHVKGSFTGAVSHKLGAVLRAAGISMKESSKSGASDGLISFNSLNPALHELKQTLSRAQNDPDRMMGAALAGVREFLDALGKAGAEVRQKMAEAHAVQIHPQGAGSDAFAAWVKKLAGSRITSVNDESSNLQFANSDFYGTLFLDEISHLEPENQAMVLRLLAEDHEISPLGFEGRIRIGNLRIIAATSNRSWQGVGDSPLQAGHSPSEDLYHRLAGHVIVIAPLRASEVRPLIRKYANNLEFWETKDGRKIVEVVCKKVDAGEFRGNRRELKRFVALTESYLAIAAQLGRGGSRTLTWEDVENEIWLPRRAVAETSDADPDGEIGEHGRQLNLLLKQEIDTVLPEAEWKGESRSELSELFIDDRHDRQKVKQLRDRLLKMLRIERKKYRDKLGKQRFDEVARAALPGVQGWNAFIDCVRKRKSPLS